MSETVPTASGDGGGEALGSVFCEQAGMSEVEKRQLSCQARRGRHVGGPELGNQQRPHERRKKRSELGQREQELLAQQQAVCGAPLGGASGRA